LAGARCFGRGSLFGSGLTVLAAQVWAPFRSLVARLDAAAAAASAAGDCAGAPARAAFKPLERLVAGAPRAAGGRAWGRVLDAVSATAAPATARGACAWVEALRADAAVEVLGVDDGGLCPER
jgi:hypothetical protein